MFNADGTTISTIYDAAGRVRFSFDELGRKTELLYDKFGRLEKTILPDPDGIGSGKSPETRYVRDAVGNVKEQWEFFGTFGATTNAEFADQFIYDKRNRLITKIDPNGDSVRSVYDVAGQLVATIDARGNANYTKYDERGRIIAQRLADPDLIDSSTQSAPVTTHKYDAAGNLVATTDAVGNTTTFAYDSLDRLRKETSTVLYDIVDNTEATGPNPKFAVWNGTGATAPESNPAAFGGSQTVISPGQLGRSEGRWLFSDLPAGTYQVLVTWPNGAGGLDTATGFTRILGNSGSILDYPGLNLHVASSEVERQFGSQWNGWEMMVPELTLNQDESLEVFLNGVGEIKADAVRVDRLVSREYTYDKNGNLISDKDSLGHTTSSFLPGLHIAGMPYAAAGTFVPGNSGCVRNMAAEPERSHIATTRSGCRQAMTSDQIPPPECPHRTQGTDSSSGWPDFLPKSPRAWRNLFSDPRRGSNHRSDPPGVRSMASFATW